MRLAAIWTVASCLLLGACASTHVVQQSSLLPDGPPVAAPHGYDRMCDEQADLCHELGQGVRPAAVEADASTELQLLQVVNREVNGQIHQRTDEETVHEEDRWQRPVLTSYGLAGDCEDIAIEKRVRLLDRGFPPQDLFFALVYRHDLGLHTVLVAHTGLGDYVLDSRSPWVTPWRQAPYVWVKRQSTLDPARWDMIYPGSTPKVTLLASNGAGLLP